METLKDIRIRQSVRQFSNKGVNSKDLDKILDMVRFAPSAYNLQELGIVYTRDKNKIEKISKYCGNQTQVKAADVFFVIFRDNYRLNSVLKENNLERADSSLGPDVLVKIDSGIMVYLLSLAATSYGYGTTIIGGVYDEPTEIKGLLNMPQENDILIGLTMGVPENKLDLDGVKPKLNKECIVMEEEYNTDTMKYMLEYDKILDDWHKTHNVTDRPAYIELVKIMLSKK